MTTLPEGGFAPRRNPDAASRSYDGEAFIVIPQSHEYKILNSVGSRVWELIDGARTLDEIARTIADEYDVSFETARDDVHSFIRDLESNGMLATEPSGRVA